MVCLFLQLLINVENKHPLNAEKQNILQLKSKKYEEL